MDFKGPGGQKRARGDAPQGEGDWTCPKCGNVNFSFRTTCNLRKCGAAKPVHPPLRTGPIYSQLHDQIPPSLYMGGGAGTPSMQMGLTPNYGVSLGIPPATGLPYEYTSSLNIPSSYNIPMQSSYGPPPNALMAGGVGYGAGSGLGYSAGSLLDGAYGMSLGMPRGPMLSMSGLGTGMYREENGSRKRRGGQDIKSDGDWTCPKCGNTNYSFRTVCNMKKCNTPKPDAPAPQTQGKPSMSEATPPDGSWTCDKCGNVNYPFRMKCNRRSCGAEKPSEAKESPMSTPPSD